VSFARLLLCLFFCFRALFVLRCIPLFRSARCACILPLVLFSAISSVFAPYFAPVLLCLFFLHF
ncbi:hypothetical protein NDU88_003546, partial [Pleurodeles waltl]